MLTFPSIPDSLNHQIALFRERGRVVACDADGFSEPSFVSMLLGLGMVPRVGATPAACA